MTAKDTAQQTKAQKSRTMMILQTDLLIYPAPKQQNFTPVQTDRICR